MLCRVLCVLILAVGACVPTAARKNAQVEHGFDFEVNAGAQVVLEGVNDEGETTETKIFPHGELDFQWGFEFANETALAVQIKVPYTIVFTTLDFFYQLPSPDNELYYGVGFELGVAPAAYGVVTQYLTNTLYMSLTPRIVLLGSDDFADRVGINPQLTLGNNDGTDVGLFLSYMRVLGEGFDFDFDFSVCPTRDERNNFLVLGASARF